MASSGIELVTVPKHGVSHASHLVNFKGRNSLLPFGAASCGNGSSDTAMNNLGKFIHLWAAGGGRGIAPVVVVE